MISRLRGGFALAAALAAAAGLEACGSRIAGGGSGIENPGLVLAFMGKDGRPEPISGSLRLFREASDWNDTGFYTRALDDQDTALISSLDLQSLPAGAIPLDSLSPDSSMGFNVIVSANGREGMLRGLRLRGNRSRGYAFEKGPAGRRPEPIEELQLAQPVLLFSGTLPPVERDKGIRVVFIPGSPYFSMVDFDGFMLFPLLPQGTFPVKAAAPNPPPVGPPLVFYCTPDSLNTSQPFAPGRWEPCDP